MKILEVFAQKILLATQAEGIKIISKFSLTVEEIKDGKVRHLNDTKWYTIEECLPYQLGCLSFGRNLAIKTKHNRFYL
jgi:hypothetical protein